MIISLMTSFCKDGTFGILSMDGMPLCVTVEKLWDNNHHDTSCIPAGTYHFTKYHSPSKGEVWITQDVETRSDIEIHAANLASELLGCIGAGQYFEVFNGVYGVTNSQATLAMLRERLPAEFDLQVIRN